MVGGVTERWKRKVAILLFLSQLALHLCRFDSPLAMLCHFLIHLKEFFFNGGPWAIQTVPPIPVRIKLK